MKRKTIYISLIIASIFVSGCAVSSQPHYIDKEKLGTSTPTTLGLDYEDIERASLKLVDSMLRSPYLNKMYETKMKKEGKPLIMMISDFTNDTTQRLDIDQIVKKIRIALLNSGKFIVTTALRAGGPEDRATLELRKLRKNKEFNQKTIAKKGTVVAPDLSLSGKIIQRVSKLANGEQRVDYYIQMSLTDVTSGLAFWEGEEVISKAGSSKSAPW
ncbi:penicillin-binding protein activator [Nitratiruptor sp. YY08-26]|uniref:penicillin-binding protein activator LpoB n=1 Tax=unclassified Nitratiruptor TaxID=2624044 RepID=UPI00191558B7|nr:MULTISPECIES: penicillin-binding protein activator LpoB [unclassified Nitratiruptor]BCD61263.1 penicillin-binding protein activator [Nitratiruptor sp. YY08-13]BCD65196.1 penicillin-binding protein activator [Nitratiruptor sp. YY08-26]